MPPQTLRVGQIDRALSYFIFEATSRQLPQCSTIVQGLRGSVFEAEGSFIDRIPHGIHYTVRRCFLFYVVCPGAVSTACVCLSVCPSACLSVCFSMLTMTYCTPLSVSVLQRIARQFFPTHFFLICATRPEHHVPAVAIGQGRGGGEGEQGEQPGHLLACRL